MEKLDKNDKGFGALPILLVVLVVGIVGITGWYAVAHKKNTQNNAVTTQSPTSETATPAQGAPDQANPISFEIKEWGVKATQPSGVNLKYTINGKTAYFTSDQLVAADSNPQCGIGPFSDGAGGTLYYAGGGSIMRFAPTDKIPPSLADNDTTTAEAYAAQDNNKSSTSHVGNYYYVYVKPQSFCSENQNTVKIQQQTQDAVKGLLQSLQAI
ncbi:MAG: hypothetical protein AAB459_04425 [Patescibacteria group bacterium]